MQRPFKYLIPMLIAVLPVSIHGKIESPFKTHPIYIFSWAAITRFKSHLSGIRGRDIEICVKVPEDMRFAAIQAIGAPIKETGSLSNAGETDQVISTSASRKKAKILDQPSNLGKGKIDKSVVDQKLAKFIISNNIPFDVQTPYLIDLLKSLAEFGPSNYGFPNSFVLKAQFMPEVDEDIKEYIRNAKLSTTTGWSLVMSNVVKDSKLECINIFAHTPVGFVYLEKIAIPEEGITLDSFMDDIYFAIELWGSLNVVQYILHLKDEDLRKIITDWEYYIDGISFQFACLITRKNSWIYVTGCASREF